MTVETIDSTPWCQDADAYLVAVTQRLDGSIWQREPARSLAKFLSASFQHMCPCVADPGEVVAGLPIATPAGPRFVGLACVLECREPWAARFASDLAVLMASRMIAPRRLLELAMPDAASREAAYMALVEANLDCSHQGTIFLTCPAR